MDNRFEMFTVLISEINRSIKKIKTEEMRTFNLKSLHVSCLYYLYLNNELTAKELCDICGEDKGQISRSIDYLEKNEYITCDSSLKKRYKSNLYLTNKGQEVGALIAKKIDDILGFVSGELSEDDRKILYKSLTIICNNLQKKCEEYGE